MMVFFLLFFNQIYSILAITSLERKDIKGKKSKKELKWYIKQRQWEYIAAEKS